MTGVAYVAIRCWKALPLSMVRLQKNQNFFKGPAWNSGLKTWRLANISTRRGKEFSNKAGFPHSENIITLSF